MIAPLGTGVTQTDKEFVRTQSEGLKKNRSLVCHKSVLCGMVNGCG